MADKQAKNADTGAAVAVDDPAKVRNVVLVGPSGSGKTTLTEALLAASGTVPRAGSVVEGTTVQLDLQSALGDVRCDLPMEDGAPGGGSDLKVRLVTGLGDLVVARAS